MMHRFLGLWTLAALAMSPLFGVAQDYAVRLGTPVVATPTAANDAGTVVILSSPAGASCSACNAAKSQLVPAQYTTCATGTCAISAPLRTTSCTACGTPACSTGACGCLLPVSTCESKPRAYCVPRPVIYPNVCCGTKPAACSTCSTCASRPCTTCATASAPCASGCSSCRCNCETSHPAPMFPILARIRRLLTGGFHSQSCGTCNTCNTCSTCSTCSTCGNGSCSPGAAPVAPAMAPQQMPAAPSAGYAPRPVSYSETPSATLPMTVTPVIQNSR